MWSTEAERLFVRSQRDICNCSIVGRLFVCTLGSCPSRPFFGSLNWLGPFVTTCDFSRDRWWIVSIILSISAGPGGLSNINPLPSFFVWYACPNFWPKCIVITVIISYKKPLMLLRKLVVWYPYMYVVFVSIFLLFSHHKSNVCVFKSYWCSLYTESPFETMAEPVTSSHEDSGSGG